MLRIPYVVVKSSFNCYYGTGLRKAIFMQVYNVL